MFQFFKREKNEEILISALLAMFLLIAFENVKACDPGYTAGQVSFKTSPECTFVIDYCYRIYQGQIEIIITRLWATDMDTPTGGTCRYFFTTVESKTVINDNIIRKICSEQSLPPCSDPALNVVVKQSTCYKYMQDGLNYYMVSHISCGWGLCKAYYKVCADYSYNPIVLQITFLYSEADQSSSCPIEPEGYLLGPGIIPGFVDYWESPCFYSNCIIN